MSIKFIYQTTELELPSPQLGDVQTFDFGLLTKRAMSGAMYTHKKTPVTRRLAMDFINLTADQTTDLLNLYLAAGGGELTLLDWRDRIWVGRITNNPFEYTVLKNFNTIHVDFEGVNSFTTPTWAIISPILLGFTAFEGIQYEVDYAPGNHAYFAGYTGIKNMFAIDATNPIAPSKTWDNYIADACYSVKRVGDFVFWGIFGGGKGIYIYDLLTSKDIPSARGSILTGFHGFEVSSDTDICYILSPSGGSRYLYRYDISNKDIPSAEAGFLANALLDGASVMRLNSVYGAPADLFVGGPVCSNITWIYVDNWATRVILASTPTGLRDFKTADNYLFGCKNTDTTFKIFELQVLPSYALIEVGSCDIGATGLSVDISDDYAFVCTGAEMKVINISNKTNPFVEFTYTPPLGGAVNCVKIGGEHNQFAYIGKGNNEGMEVVQVRQSI